MLYPSAGTNKPARFYHLRPDKRQFYTNKSTCLFMWIQHFAMKLLVCFSPRFYQAVNCSLSALQSPSLFCGNFVCMRSRLQSHSQVVAKIIPSVYLCTGVRQNKTDILRAVAQCVSLCTSYSGPMKLHSKYCICKCAGGSFHHCIDIFIPPGYTLEINEKSLYYHAPNFFFLQDLGQRFLSMHLAFFVVFFCCCYHVPFTHTEMHTAGRQCSLTLLCLLYRWMLSSKPYRSCICPWTASCNTFLCTMFIMNVCLSNFA